MQFLLYELVVTLRIIILYMQHIVFVLVLIRIHLLFSKALRYNIQLHAPAAVDTAASAGVALAIGATLSDAATVWVEI